MISQICINIHKHLKLIFLFRYLQPIKIVLFFFKYVGTIIYFFPLYIEFNQKGVNVVYFYQYCKHVKITSYKLYQ